jgi:Tfp pilus assembly protein PilO
MKIDVNLAAVREKLLSPLGWHLAACGALAVLTVGLGVRLGLDWTATNGTSTEALESKQVQLKALDLQTAPLRGLDKRVDQAHLQLASFYARRVPPNYSAISMRIGELAIKSGVRLTRVQYTQGKPGSVLTEIAMDAGIGGDYPSIMRFVNSVERDPEFFLIRGMNFTGQQGGQVNVRIQISTWLRPADALASGLPETPEPDARDEKTAQKEDR